MGKKSSSRWPSLPDNLKDRVVQSEHYEFNSDMANPKNESATVTIEYEKPKKPTKYHNKKCEYDGHKFDSQKERDYYIDLKNRQSAGEILNFTCQPELKYLVTYSVPGGKSFEKGYKYIADFQVNYPDGHSEVVDCKGLWKGSLTPEFKRKRMIIKKLYGIIIKIV
jgi:hypothetical protein